MATRVGMGKTLILFVIAFETKQRWLAGFT